MACVFYCPMRPSAANGYALDVPERVADPALYKVRDVPMVTVFDTDEPRPDTVTKAVEPDGVPMVTVAPGAVAVHVRTVVVRDVERNPPAVGVAEPVVGVNPAKRSTSFWRDT